MILYLRTSGFGRSFASRQRVRILLLMRSTSLMFDTRSVESHDSLCPAAAAVGETITGSGVLCRVSGNILTTGENPSSLRAFCWNRLPSAIARSVDGQEARHGYCECPLWRHNRKIELGESDEQPFVAPATT